MAALLDNRRSRSRAGALLELSAMANERVRLALELDRWRDRQAEIEARLREIGAKEQRLLAMAQDRCASSIVAGSHTEPSKKSASQSEPPRRVRTTEFTY